MQVVMQRGYVVKKSSIVKDLLSSNKKQFILDSGLNKIGRAVQVPNTSSICVSPSHI